MKKNLSILCIFLCFQSVVLAYVSVTFQVDMTGQTISPNGVHIAGNFQNIAAVGGDWTPDSTPLTSIGNGIYTVTLNIPSPPSTYLYRYINGNTWGEAEILPSTCASGGENRLLQVYGSFGDIIILPVVCFSRCSSCENIVKSKIFLTGVDTLSNLNLDNLRGLASFPTNDPYSSPPLNNSFTHVNSGSIATINPSILNINTNNAIIDWLFIELQSDTPTGVQTVYSKAALLQKDGDVVNTDGISPLRFTSAVSGNYYLKISHRNHLPFRTLNKIVLGTTPINVDATNVSIPSYSPLKRVSTDKVSLIGGDANADGTVDAFDNISWFNQNGLFNNYFNSADYNLDGSIDAFDDIFWQIHNGLFFP